MYPALSVLHTLLEGDDRMVEMGEDETIVASHLKPSEALWVGSERGLEVDLVKVAGIPFEAIPAAGLHGVGLRQLPGNLSRMAHGILASRRVLQRFRPDVLFFTGGYVGVPLALASRIPYSGIRRPAILLYVPDIEPGKALRALSKFADQIALTVEESRPFFSKRASTSVTGYPVRKDLSSWNRQSARDALHLDHDLTTLLVLGGSRGARSINRAIMGVLPQLLQEMQVVHVTGNLDWPEVETALRQLKVDLSEEIYSRYHPHPYLHREMGAALHAADLVVSRAGASILGEYPLVGLPAILVPYPYAWRYQRTNARYLADRGAAVVLDDKDLSQRLLSTVLDLMSDISRRESMSDAMISLASPHASRKIAAILANLAFDRSRRRD